MYCSLFQYAEQVIRTWPGSLAYSSLASRSLELALAVPDRINYEFVKLLLDHGADIRSCTPAWTNLVIRWVESHGEPAFDQSMWAVAQLLVRHGACLNFFVQLPLYDRYSEVKILLAACVPEEALDELDDVLEDVSSPGTESQIASRTEEIRHMIWPRIQTCEGREAQMSMEMGEV